MWLARVARAAVLTLTCGVGGCSLVIGEIELPAPIALDAADLPLRDAEPPRGDAAPEPPDAAPRPTDGAPPDLGVPDFGLPVDAAPEADGATPPSRLVGTWHFYGATAGGPFGGALRVGDDGVAEGRTLADEPAAADVVSWAAGEVVVQLPVGGKLAGAIDSELGLGVVVGAPGSGDESSRFAVLARQEDGSLPESAVYVDARLLPVGRGELGSLTRVEPGRWQESDRRTVSGSRPDDRLLTAEARGPRVALTRGAQELGRLYSAARTGAVGFVVGAEVPLGLSVAWSFSAVARAPEGRYLCAGVRQEGAAMVAVRLGVAVDGASLRWADGRAGNLVRRDGPLGQIDAGGGLFGDGVELMMADETGRALLLLPVDWPVDVSWGLALCVSAGREGDAAGAT